MGLRDRLVDAAARLGGLDAVVRLRSHLPLRWLTVLTYHRVVDLPDGYPFDDDVPDATPRSFDEQMALVARECHPVSLADLRAHFEGEPLPPRAVMVTFDDGYLDNLESAAVILRRHGVPAVFFIATDYIERRRLFWWDKIAYLLSRSPRDRLSLRYPVPLSFRLPDERGRAQRYLLRLIKSVYDLDVDELLRHLADACGVRLDADEEAGLADRLLLTWDGVRALRDAGMDVQSHTVSHRALHTLRLADLDRELQGSRRTLGEQVGHAPDAMAFPVGTPLGALPHVAHALERAGYRFGFANGTGVVPLWRPATPLHLQRVAIRPGWSREQFRAAIHLPTP